MAEIIIGERVINKIGEIGTIVSFDDKYICVAYNSRTAKLQLDAFEQGFLKYENASLQDKINEGINEIKNKEEKEAENRRIAKSKAEEERRRLEAQAPVGTKFNSVSIRLEPAPVSLSSVKRKHKELVQEIFNQCDKDIRVYYDMFHPSMKYVVPNGYSFVRMDNLRSRYCTGFITNYENTYVMRVFSRNDVYKPGMIGGITVANSDTTEIIRIMRIDDEVYYFSKHLSCATGSYKNTKLYKKWHASEYVDLVNLDEVVRICDCKYLNDYVEEKSVNCFSYARLLMPALYDNKAEIVFKNKLFLAVSGIDNIVKYLAGFSSKQIDFASKNKVINTLSFIKKYGLYDIKILKNMEDIVKKNRNGRSVYDDLVEIFCKYNLDLSVIDKKLIGFLRKIEGFNIHVYGDYIYELARNRIVTLDDIFARDYMERHLATLEERSVYYTKETSELYTQVASELSWIDREENGYFIIVPKTIPEFLYEGQMQHNCVYTSEYFYEVVDRQSIIIFLRKEKEVPFVTVELDYKTFEIKQAYGKYNQIIDNDLYKYIEGLAKELYHEMISRE